MIQIKDKSQCTGCTACFNSCSHEAIRMEYDSYGHSYPVVNVEKCTECGLCERVCPLLHKEDFARDEEKGIHSLPVYACFSKKEEIRKSSTSGGLFSVLAEYVISRGGIVCAAEFDRRFHIHHVFVDRIGDLNRLKGSKYAQSELGYAFSEVRKELRVGKEVLFVGTPCQVAGLKFFLRKDYPNLYTCDFICMGISSPVLWEEYLDNFENREHIRRILFKDKRRGWHNWQMLIEYPNKEKIQEGYENPFFNSYLNHITFRPSCFRCPYRRVHRMSDFTIADCWGIDQFNPSFDDNKGCTTLILQNEKAESVFEQLKSQVHYMEYPIENVIRYNPHICSSVSVHPMTEQFYLSYWKEGYKKAALKYCVPVRCGVFFSLVKRVYGKLKNMTK